MRAESRGERPCCDRGARRAGEGGQDGHAAGSERADGGGIDASRDFWREAPHRLLVRREDSMLARRLRKLGHFSSVALGGVHRPVFRLQDVPVRRDREEGLGIEMSSGAIVSITGAAKHDGLCQLGDLVTAVDGQSAYINATRGWQVLGAPPARDAGCPHTFAWAAPPVSALPALTDRAHGRPLRVVGPHRRLTDRIAKIRAHTDDRSSRAGIRLSCHSRASECQEVQASGCCWSASDKSRLVGRYWHE